MKTQEAKVYSFQKEKSNISKDDMKDIHDALFDIIDIFRNEIEHTEKTKTILYLLVTARSEMRSYIEESAAD